LLSAKLIIPEHNILPYLLPMPAVSKMLALVCGVPTAIVVAACLSLAVGQLASSNMALELVMYAFVGSAIAALGLQRAERMNAFARAGVLTALTNVSIILIFAFMVTQPIPADTLWLRLGAAVLNAMLTSSFALAGYTLAGHYLGIMTPTQLQELARPTHPLLRQLLLNAPGTYSHTLMISNMAEHAAEAIGADPLLARVAAYYHDIGKLVQPFFFIENQANRVNPHDELNDPYESARIIIQHVTDGVALARKYRLPRQIVDVIPQHHGTMLVAYFYRVAKQRAPNGEVDERAFRYPGPRPQTREAAIIMLADGAEATTRARHPNTVQELDDILKTIFRDRLLSGELDACDLHLRDLDQIRQAFLEILQGQLHPRIVYPGDSRESQPTPTQGVWLETPTIPEKEK
jgi:putative nucleotidyltransferase with HDIG domain